MNDLVHTNDISEDDYRAIEEAVMETARGRWFLAEYAKRNRTCNTEQVLEAIDELKNFVTSDTDTADLLKLRLEIIDMTNTIDSIKTEIANSSDDGNSMTSAQVELNVVVDETETATSTILGNAEKLQEMIWEARDKGFTPEDFDKMDELITETYLACSFQDLVGQRVRKVVDLMAVIEKRLNKMLGIWDEDELTSYREETKQDTQAPVKLENGPALPGEAQKQDEIDNVLFLNDTDFATIDDLDDIEFDAISVDDDPVEAVEETSEEPSQDSIITPLHERAAQFN